MIAWLLLVVTVGSEPAPESVKLYEIFRNEFVLITPGQAKFPADAHVKEPFAIAPVEVPQNLWESISGQESK